MSSMSVTTSDQLERLQRRAGRICLRKPLFSRVNHSAPLHQLEWSTLASRRKFRQAQLAHQLTHGLAPLHLQCDSLYRRAPEISAQLRHPRVYWQPMARTSRHRDSPINMATHVYNTLPTCTRTLTDRAAFNASVSPLLLSSICCCSKHPDFRF